MSHIEYHSKKVKLVPRLKGATAEQPHTRGTYVPEPNRIPPPPPPEQTSPWVVNSGGGGRIPPAPVLLTAQPRIATLEDLIANGFIYSILLKQVDGRIQISTSVMEHQLQTDGATACEAVRKLSSLVLDKRFEL